MIYDLQKASVWKRFAAWLLDNILVSILVVGIAFLLSSVLGYDHYSDRVSEIYDQYEAKYGVSFTVGPDEYESWTEEERQTFDQAYQELVSDEEAMYAYIRAEETGKFIPSLFKPIQLPTDTVLS